MLIPQVLGLALLAAALAAPLGGPSPAAAQVFFATQPDPRFALGPLFVRATVGPDLGPITVDVLWSLAIPATESALGLDQDLYLLWPGQVRGDGPAPPDHELARYFTDRGFTVVREGSLLLSEQDLYPPPGGGRTERPLGYAPFVTFSRQGLRPVGLRSGASYVRIPWTPTLVNRIRLVKLRMTIDDLVQRQPTSWLQEALWGRRYLVALGWDDVRDQTVFPVYLENRSQVIRLADEPAQIIVRFQDRRQLRIDEVFPQSSSRRSGVGGETDEVVSLFLDSSQGLAPQTLSIRFGYATRLQTWAPILIPVFFFLLGRTAGPLVERLSRGVVQRMAARIHVGPLAGGGTQEGVFLPREALAQLVPGKTTLDEALDVCGRDVPEERQDLASPDRRTLLYRGRRLVPHHQRSFVVFATVDHWEVEEQEVEIAAAGGLVQDVQVRLRRTRLPRPERG